MFNCRLENKNGDIITITQNESDYQVLSIDGLNPPSAKINTILTTSVDGAKFNSSKLETRNIVIRIKINGDIEANRLNLYNYCRTKEWAKFYYQNASRNVYIECYVEQIECDLFTRNEIMQISLLCPSSYFKDLYSIYDDISKIQALFEFPFSIDSDGIEFSSYNFNLTTNIINTSESETGVIITTDFIDTVELIEIKNTTNGEYFKIDYTFLTGDKLIIDTNKGQKSVVLIRNAVIINMFPYIIYGSTFFQLQTGNNLFTYLINDEIYDNKVNMFFEHRNIYRGV